MVEKSEAEFLADYILAKVALDKIYAKAERQGDA
jgi:hypothetical protein